MIKKGEYAIYKGKEYSIIVKDNFVTLRSFDKSELKNGFRVGGLLKNVYLKDVTIDQLEDAYEIIPHAVFKGHDFGIAGYNEEKGIVTLVTNNPNLMKELNLESHAKYEYNIDVHINEIKILEDKVPILGFGN